MRDRGDEVDPMDPDWLTRWFVRTEKSMDMTQLSDDEIWVLLAHAVIAGSSEFGSSRFVDLAGRGFAVRAEWCIAAALFIESWTGVPTHEVLADLIVELRLLSDAREVLQTIRCDPTSIVPWLQMDLNSCSRWADDVEAELHV